MALDNRHPCPDCHLPCDYHGRPMCVCNLISLGGQNAPITLGVHLGLSHIYGDKPLPTCVRGNLGSGYWSTEQDCTPLDPLPLDPISNDSMACNNSDDGSSKAIVNKLDEVILALKQ